MPKAGNGFKLTDKMREEIIKLIDERVRLYYVTREDFNELKEIVKELAEAQKRTEERLNELAEAQKRTEERLNELAEAQKRTEERLNQLAEAQRKTEERLNQLAQRVDELAEAQKKTEEEIRKLTVAVRELQIHVGGLSNSFGYAFENETYRMLPGLLRERYGIELTERFIRTEIGGKEINILGFGRKDGVEVIVVGEVKTKIDDIEVFDELEEKVRIVKQEYPNKEIIRVLVTHFAVKKILNLAKERGVIVIQSFEW